MLLPFLLLADCVDCFLNQVDHVTAAVRNTEVFDFLLENSDKESDSENDRDNDSSTKKNSNNNGVSNNNNNDNHNNDNSTDNNTSTSSKPQPHQLPNEETSPVILTGKALDLGKWHVHKKYFDDQEIDLLYPQNGMSECACCWCCCCCC